jgi:methyltransferase (TIGR00027 family)
MTTRVAADASSTGRSEAPQFSAGSGTHVNYPERSMRLPDDSRYDSELMPEIDGKIAHVSDTALMIAACRAREHELEDAFVHDPFASRLAGDRGVAILRALPYSNVLRLGIAIRTRFVDELLLDTLATHSIATVLSVGCGLDTRPWRLDLSPDLRWIEIDFADVLDYKDGLMSGERSRCRRERLTVDLNDAAQRRSMYEAAGSTSAIMITEGLLLYLPAPTVDALATEAPAHSGIAHWISDITTAAFSKVLGGGADTMQPIRHVQAPDALKGEQILEVLQRHGWKTSAMRSYITDVDFVMDRVRRAMGGATPPRRPYPPNDPTGVHLFVWGQ